MPQMSRVTTDSLPGAARFAIVAMVIAVWTPMTLQILGLRLDSYRIFVLLAALPVIVAFLNRDIVTPNLSDLLFTLFTAWLFLTFLVIHGQERFNYAVMTALEYQIGYMLARILIRGPRAYRFFLDALLVSFVVMLPILYVELFTNRQILQDVLGSIVPVSRKVGAEMRLNLFRSAGTMPHPILFGMFCSTFLAAMLYRFRGAFSKQVFACAVVTAMTFASLSSAPLLSLMLQILLIAWAVVMKGRWKLLILTFVAIYIFLELASNRGPIILLIETLTLSPRTAWWRVHVWNFGVDNVLANPIFGIGLNDWVRPSWLAPTVDNFWLNTALRHGLPAVIFLIAALALHYRRVVTAGLSDPDLRSLRLGYLISLTGLFFTLATVFAWGPIVLIISFFFGAGAFFYAPAQETAAEATPQPEASGQRNRTPAFTRFGPRPSPRHRHARPGPDSALS